MSQWSFPPASTSSSKYSNPPGYAPPSSSSKKAIGASKTNNAASSNTVTVAGNKSLESLRQQRAWDIAIGPAKSLLMQGFMLYMSGGGVQIFSLMIVFQLITGALGGMAGVNQTFEPLEQQTAASEKQARQSYTQQKIIHVLSQGLLLALGLYKCHTMGLLPTHDSDWLAFSKQRIPTEVSEISLGGWWQQ